MKSPLTGKEMHLEREPRELEFRKEPFSVIYHYYLCAGTGEQFTDDALDNLNLNQVYNQYRAKYGIPFVDEIKKIREKYGLSAAKMSDVLGLGANVYRQYEAGEMPSVSTGRLIRMAEDPKEFLKLLEIGRNALEPHEYERVLRKVHHAMDSWQQLDEHIEQWLFETKLPNIFNGYRMPCLDKIGRMVSFFADRNKPFLTALNKLMFYADFGHFKKYGTSISGLYYHAIQKGPVPNNYGGIYNQLVNSGYIKLEEIGFRDFVGEQYLCADKAKAELVEDLFSPSEIDTLKNVAERFYGLNTRQIVEISHQEEAWQHNIGDYGRINYVYAFRLKQIN